MIENSVVLVLGAGASKPYGFPLGHELLVRAAEDRALYKALSWLQQPLPGQVPQFQAELRESKSPSIDAFVENRPEFEVIGKAAIAFYLVGCERKAELFRADNQDDWYRYLLDMMLSDGYGAFASNRLRIITYNYDRSLEYAFLRALMFRYGKPLQECANQLRGIDIIHLHGELGGLPELSSEGGQRPYDTNVDPRYLNVAMQGIRIVHEADPNDDRFENAREALKDADYVIFLGFGYLRENLKRLRLQVHCRSSTVFCGTGVNITESESKLVRSLFPDHGKWPRITIDLHSQNVLEYMRNNLDLFTKVG